MSKFTNLLSIDTSTPIATVAVASAKGMVQLSCEGSKKHAEHLFQLIDAVLSKSSLSVNDLEGVIYGRGPGGFTGLRVAASAAAGFASSLDIPVSGVSTLQAMAKQASCELGVSRLWTALDARMNEVYLACWEIIDDASPVALIDECVCPPKAILGYSDLLGLPIVGSGVDVYQSCFYEASTSLFPNISPQAETMLALGKAQLLKNGGDANVAPVYLRNNIVQKN